MRRDGARGHGYDFDRFDSRDETSIGPMGGERRGRRFGSACRVANGAAGMIVAVVVMVRRIVTVFAAVRPQNRTGQEKFFTMRARPARLLGKLMNCRENKGADVNTQCEPDRRIAAEPTGCEEPSHNIRLGGGVIIIACEVPCQPFGSIIPSAASATKADKR